MTDDPDEIIVEVSPDPDLIVFEIEVPSEIDLIVAEVEGEQGPAGRPGTDSASVINATAAAACSGHRTVRGTSEGVVPCSSSDTATLGQAIGVTLGAAVSGAPIQLQASGEIVEPSWTWIPGRVWLGEAGLLTQTRPTAGYLQQIGVSNGPTKLIVAIGMPIQLT